MVSDQFFLSISKGRASIVTTPPPFFFGVNEARRPFISLERPLSYPVNGFFFSSINFQAGSPDFYTSVAHLIKDLAHVLFVVSSVGTSPPNCLAFLAVPWSFFFFFWWLGLLCPVVVVVVVFPLFFMSFFFLLYAAC